MGNVGEEQEKFLKRKFLGKKCRFIRGKNQENMILRPSEVYLYMEKSTIIFFNRYVADWKLPSKQIRAAVEFHIRPKMIIGAS